MKGDKAAAEPRPFGDCGDQQPNLLRSKSPYSFQLSGEKSIKVVKYLFSILTFKKLSVAGVFLSFLSMLLFLGSALSF